MRCSRSPQEKKKEEIRTANTPFTTKLWNFLRVTSYDLLNAGASSSDLFACRFCSALQVKERPRINHMRPSVAVRFFSPFSFSTSCSRVADLVGAALYRVRTFCNMQQKGVTTSHVHE